MFADGHNLLYIRITLKFHELHIMAAAVTARGTAAHSAAAA